MATISKINDLSGNTHNIANTTFYGTCSTNADVSTKVVTLSSTDGWKLKAGTIVGVKFTYSNTAENVTLNINGTGAKSIYYNNAVYTSTSKDICGYANRVNYYMYDGTYWVFLHNGIIDSNSKVTQTVTTTDASYEVLFSSTADNTTRTEGARKNSNLLFNPSTGTLTATKLTGQIDSTLQSSDVTIANGDKLVVTDASDSSKVARTSVSFDGSTTDKFLSKAGTFESVSGGITALDVYPVGSIYMSVNSTSPATLFGGTWEQLQDRFLLAAGSTYTAGDTGGSATMAHTHDVTSNVTIGDTTLTTNQIPSHQHSTTIVWDRLGANHYVIRGMNYGGNSSWSIGATGGGQSHTHTPTNKKVTSGAASNTDNMPPYLAVYMWKRTA